MRWWRTLVGFLWHWVITDGPTTAPIVAAVLAGWWLARHWRASRRHHRLAVGARMVTILAPPVVDPTGAQALWANLVGLLRPGWRRWWSGEPHLAFEYVFSETGVVLRLWVPEVVPPGLVERALEAAWPGAHTEPRSLLHQCPHRGRAAGRCGGGSLTGPGGGLAVPHRFDADPLRALLGAPSAWPRRVRRCSDPRPPGHRSAVQHARRTAHATPRTPVASTPSAAAGPAHPRHRPPGPRDTGRGAVDPQTSLEAPRSTARS